MSYEGTKSERNRYSKVPVYISSSEEEISNRYKDPPTPPKERKSIQINNTFCKSKHQKRLDYTFQT